MALLTFAGTPVFAGDQIFLGVGFDEALSGGPRLVDALRLADVSDKGLTLNLRLIVERESVEREPGSYDFVALDARIAEYSHIKGLRTYIDLRGSEPRPDGLDAWGRLVRAVATRYRGQVRGYVFGGRVSAIPPAVQDYAFFVKTTAVNVRAGDEDAATIMGGVRPTDAAWLASLYAQDIAPYVDAIGVEEEPVNSTMAAVIDEHDPGTRVVLFGQSLGQIPADGAKQFLEIHLRLLGTRTSGVSYVAPVPVIAAVLAPIVALGEMLGQELVAIDEAPIGLHLTRAGDDVTSRIPHKLLFGLQSLTSYFVYFEARQPLELVLSEPTGIRPTIDDAIGRGRIAANAFSYDSAARIARMELTAGPGARVVDWSSGKSDRYTAQESVSSPTVPTVAEIVARHQQAQAVQDALLKSYIADATMEQHFRSAGIDSGFDVVTENRFFVEGKNAEWEERSFRLNGTKWGPKRPPFPLLQAEKVLSLPLDLRLSTDYRYRLTGVEEIEGRTCFALRFDPIAEDRALYRGTVWIDRQTYLKVKVQTLQARLSSPVLSSEEIQYFSSVGSIGDRDIQLLTRLVGRQIMLIAGRNLLVERGIRMDRFELNAADFPAQRDAARASDHVMYRDTIEGLRYLVKRDGVREVQVSTTTALAGLAGVTYDPSYDYPLPLVGVDYLNFNFRGKDNQLAVVFGGVLALVNLQHPKLLGEHVDGSLDLFAIAVKANDRTYDLTGERTRQRLTTLPFSTGFNVGWQLAEFQKLAVSYQFRFDAFSTTPETAATFRPPVSTVTNGVGLSWEWKQGGYSFLVSGTSSRRAQWQPWGDPDDYRPTDQSYVKYSASLTRDYYWGLQKIHLNGAYYGGRNLDRFSAYQFGLFDDNKIHGVPSAGVRFGELAMVRGSYSFNLLDQYRLDLFLDQALGRGPRSVDNWQGLTGIGIGGNLRGPFNTLLRGDVGKSFLPTQYRQPGSIVIQFQILKPL